MIQVEQYAAFEPSQAECPCSQPFIYHNRKALSCHGPDPDTKELFLS